MYKFIGSVGFVISSLFFGGVTFADRVDDISAKSPVEYCQVVAEEFLMGADARVNGFARKLSDASPVLELVEHGFPLPKESMWVLWFNQLTEREKEWYSKNVFDGWDAANAGLTSGQQLDDSPVQICMDSGACSLFPRWIANLTQTRFEHCLAERARKQSQAKSEHMTKDKDYLRKQYEGRGRDSTTG